MTETYQVEFNRHVYDLPVQKAADGSSLVQVDFIHRPGFMHDAAVDANRYMNRYISNTIDVIVTPECRCITLATQLAFMNGCQIVMLRKSLLAGEKLHPYWTGTYQPRTHSEPISLYLTEKKATLLKGKKILVLDDVSSTGKTLIAIHELLSKAGINASYFFSIFDDDCEKDIGLASLPSYYFLKSLPYFE